MEKSTQLQSTYSSLRTNFVYLFISLKNIMHMISLLLSCILRNLMNFTLNFRELINIVFLKLQLSKITNLMHNETKLCQLRVMILMSDWKYSDSLTIVNEFTVIYCTVHVL